MVDIGLTPDEYENYEKLLDAGFNRTDAVKAIMAMEGFTVNLQDDFEAFDEEEEGEETEEGEGEEPEED